MIIDFHTHVFPEKLAPKALNVLSERAHITPDTDGTAAGLKKSMKKAGVDVSVTLPVITDPAQFDTAFEFALRLNTDPGLQAFGCIHPDMDDVKGKLRLIKNRGLKGIKIHPDYQGADIDDDRFLKLIDAANDIGLWVVTHAGIDAGLPEAKRSTPDKIARMYDTVRPDRFIAAHMGGWGGWDIVLDKLCGTDIYFDTAFCFNGTMDESVFRDIVRAHGADRILFATDCPWSSQEHDIRHLNSLSWLTSEEKRRITEMNARRILEI